MIGHVCFGMLRWKVLSTISLFVQLVCNLLAKSQKRGQGEGLQIVNNKSHLLACYSTWKSAVCSYTNNRKLQLLSIVYSVPVHVVFFMFTALSISFISINSVY